MTIGIAFVAAAAGVSAPAAAAPAAPSVLTKSAQDVTSPGANPVNHGDTLNWVLNYQNNGPAGPSAATITDPINGAGTTQTYVPGSLQVPPGWTPSWSTDGTNYQTTDPGTATVAVRATNPGARPGGTNLANILLAPVKPTATPTGGDGYTPIIFRRPSGTVEAWNMYHHLVAAAPKLVCTDLTAGAPCAGGPWPRPVNTAPGPFGTGSTGDIASTLTPQYVQDPGRPGVVYYAAVTASSVGVGCLDLGTRANCGYFPLIATGPGGANGLAGLVTTAGNLYGVGSNGQVLCLTIASHSPCAGQPYAPIVPANNNSPGANYMGSMAIAGGKVFASSSPAGGAPVLGCFDPATATACSGWATPQAIAPPGNSTYNAYTAYDTASNSVGACATTTGNPTSTTTCFTVGGAPLAAPTVFNSLANRLIFNPETATGPDGHLRSYTGTWGGSSTGDTVCYDWNTAAACAGFPLPATHPSANGGVTRDYGYAYDQVTQCLFGLGDAGILFSEDPTTSSSPCIHSGAEVTLSPSAFYCDGATGHIRSYTDARLDNMNLANVNLTASTAEVSDTGGSVIAHPAFAPDGTLDLSGISPAAHPGITVSAHLVLNNSNDFTGGNQPHLVVAFDGDAPQVCFKTTVSPTCTATGVSDTATGDDTTGTLTSNTVNLPVAPGPACQPAVTINKEICASNNDNNCQPGGPGPWAKQATPGLLGLLLANPHWRITVTNAGPTGITGATINDSAVPSCRSAAGTFGLAAGESKQIFCSTSLLLSLLPFTNTASATYTPANSPAGTPPSRTSGSSAVACSLLWC
ncbi:DUF7617 domain-containing protein [Amycolatopsis panacis]|uniref:DUF7617 domain-containing protein n=1 Tax=Amycolatopsis panacis TaxID=2340917 RepID=A0A419I6X0_9PSEU|nr:hypothetical protein [Amycolatopsis panacis]RJQ87219.1 hypothetical protein D5S19_09735 [Amycolatopsis panacis]